MKKSAFSGAFWNLSAPLATDWVRQAMKTAMKANKKIKMAPPKGSTMGIKGTMDSTTSCSPSWWVGWSLDMWVSSFGEWQQF
jgi:hypothetical protein